MDGRWAAASCVPEADGYDAEGASAGTRCDERPPVAAEVDALDPLAPNADRLADDVPRDARQLGGAVTRRDGDRLHVGTERDALWCAAAEQKRAPGPAARDVPQSDAASAERIDVGSAAGRPWGSKTRSWA
jgi:hypothetical protein